MTSFSFGAVRGKMDTKKINKFTFQKCKIHQNVAFRHVGVRGVVVSKLRPGCHLRPAIHLTRDHIATSCIRIILRSKQSFRTGWFGILCTLAEVCCVPLSLLSVHGSSSLSRSVSGYALSMSGSSHTFTLSTSTQRKMHRACCSKP